MIVYFSGNGNSRHVAQRLGELLDDNRVVRINRELINQNTLHVDADDRLVWVLPVYAWGIPPVVERFMKSVSVDRTDVPHYMVVTCGDDTGNIDRQWRCIMRNRGFEARGCWSVTMPNTYVTLPGFDVDSDDVEHSKLDASAERISHVAQAIARGCDATDILRGSMAWLKSGIVKAWFHRFAMSARPFHSTDACVGCGACARSCPMNNVVMTDGRPMWRDDCAFCLACYHHCPHHAVAYGGRTRRKGQYVYPAKK